MVDKLVERLRALAAKQREQRGDMLTYGSPDPEIVEAADALAIAQKRVNELEAENARLSEAVCSRILPGLLDDEETDALVSFVKQLRAGALPTMLKGNGE